MSVCEDTVHLLAGQKRFNNEYIDSDVLPKVDEADMAGTMESIKEYLRSCHGVIRAPLANVMRSTITVQTYGDYPMYATPDSEMIARTLHLLLDKNKLHNEQSAVSQRMYSRVQDRQQKCL